ncbi:helix-loop-helix protein 6 [Trichinella spiralis]|uniref:helix-loop-helix protein 6 n=1 Tax=Trichinella spiralis TaxID=6334 RepID=UPI0001EFDE00|nr:helix-loop-helix protein 6 [Trichinella spiralis]
MKYHTAAGTWGTHSSSVHHRNNKEELIVQINKGDTGHQGYDQLKRNQSEHSEKIPISKLDCFIHFMYRYIDNESKLLSSIEFNVQSESDWLIIILTLAANVSLEKQLGTQLPKRKVEK